MTKLSYSDIVKKHISPDTSGIRENISSLLKEKNIKLVILDDDPTGIQTVHGCLLLTQWDTKTVEMAFEDSENFFYILTNTRAMTNNKALTITNEVVEKVLAINKNFGFKLIFISRSDSTLRGHFPMEPDSIRKVIEEQGTKLTMPSFFIPCFFEAGRYTYKNWHYLKVNDELIPVNETEFAQDNVFGYKNANLIEYIIEKSENTLNTQEIGNLSIDQIRTLSENNLQNEFDKQKTKKYVVVNALDYCDLQIFSMNLLNYFIKKDEPMVLRTSSSLPKALSGITDKALLQKQDLKQSNNPGIFIVGSHVNKTSVQLNELLKCKNVTGIEINVEQVISAKENTLDISIIAIQQVWEAAKTPVIYTSRKEIRSTSATERQEIGKRISDFLVNIVQNLPSQPGYIVAKGGITSHDILMHGLALDFARVAGQLLPGIPAITTGKDHKYPNLPYVIFPGNVGDDNALAEAFEILK